MIRRMCAECELLAYSTSPGSGRRKLPSEGAVIQRSSAREPAGQPQWVAPLFGVSVWEDSCDERFVAVSGSETPRGMQYMWTEEFVLRKQPRHLHWAATWKGGQGHPGMDVAKAYVRQKPDDGCRVFWVLVDWQRAAGVRDAPKWLSVGMRHWIDDVGRCGISPIHRQCAEYRRDDMRYSGGVIVSSPLLLWCLCRWTCRKFENNNGNTTGTSPQPFWQKLRFLVFEVAHTHTFVRSHTLGRPV